MGDRDTDDPAGDYTLVSVDEAKVPATVSHHDQPVQVHSGSFTINADGTCISRTVFSRPGGDKVTREVHATYSREGSTLKMKWEGAGQTVGNFKGDSFTMNNEDMIFLYRR